MLDYRVYIQLYWLVDRDAYIGLSSVNPIDMGNIIPYMTYKKNGGTFFHCSLDGLRQIGIGRDPKLHPLS